MRDTDADQFVCELGKTAECLGEAVSMTRAMLYFEALADLPVEAVVAALAACRRTQRFFPKPSELREAVVGTPGDAAVQAWARLLWAVEAVGTGESVDFADPALHATIEAMGGWPEMYVLERLDGRDLGFRHAEFTRLYLTFSVRLPDRAPQALLGSHALSNRLTRGGWTHRLGHVDLVHQIGPAGLPAIAKALSAPATKALPSDPEAENFSLDKG